MRVIELLFCVKFMEIPCSFALNIIFLNYLVFMGNLHYYVMFYRKIVLIVEILPLFF